MPGAKNYLLCCRELFISENEEDERKDEDTGAIYNEAGSDMYEEGAEFDDVHRHVS
jgi:hypothetical protein